MAKQTIKVVRVDLTDDEMWRLKQVAAARKTTVTRLASRALRRLLRGAAQLNPALSVSENDNPENRQ